MEQIKNINIKNFRCFKDLSLNITEAIVLIKGSNGTGKTTILEALNYAATLRSFRTAHLLELINFDSLIFYIKLEFSSLGCIKTVFTNKKKIIKLDEKVLKSHSEISLIYQAISITEDDLELIKEGPELRRNFLDTILIATISNYNQLLKEHKKIVDQRAALLQNNLIDKNYYNLWTTELCKKSNQIIEQRVLLLDRLVIKINYLLKNFIKQDFTVNLIYLPKYNLPKDSNLQDDALFEQEKRLGRNLIGAQLDDILIKFQDQKTRSFASRGQQKLLVLIFKIVALEIILESQKKPELILFLLDDFLTDLDPNIIKAILNLIITFPIQVFITLPNSTDIVENYLEEINIKFQKILL